MGSMEFAASELVTTSALPAVGVVFVVSGVVAPHPITRAVPRKIQVRFMVEPQV